MTSKLALGIHHFNVAYNLGNEASYHRQVREAVAPFLDLAFQYSDWEFSIEMAGLSIEFIALKYPSLLNRLRTLIDRGQIELISCTYAPQIWTVFPGNDLIRSIKMNDSLLRKYNLTRSRIFFSQENFIGPGVKKLHKWFDTIIVKDDYYSFLYGDVGLAPYYLYDKMKLLIAESHILEEVSREINTNSCYQKIFERASTFLEATDLASANHPVREHTHGPMTWRWYHVGSSERFSKADNRPEHISTCIFDEEWVTLVINTLNRIVDQGFRLSTIDSFMKMSTRVNEKFKAESASLLLEGNWNMKKSEAGFIWMGKNVGKYEDDLLVRNHNWKSRSRLLALESLVKCLYSEGQVPSSLTKSIKQAWRHQLIAETSDATGWAPNKCEVNHGLMQSETVLNLVEELCQAVKQQFSLGRIAINTRLNEIRPFRPQSSSDMRAQILDLRQLFVMEPEVYGMDHKIGSYKISNHLQLVTVDFWPSSDECGIKFKFSGEHLRYGSSVMENEMTVAELDSIESDYLCLPLSNGLIALNNSVYLIKHNEYVNIGCNMDKYTQSLTIKIQNPVKRQYHWRFSLFKGTQEEAISYANNLNVFPTVVL